jgi:transposase
MQVYGSILPGAARLAHLLPTETARVRAEARLSPGAAHRLKIIRWHEAHGSKVSLTARHFGFSRSTLYIWLKRYRESGPRGLEEHSRRPHCFRQRTWTEVEVDMVGRLRRQHPRWGKDKLVVLLHARGFQISVSRVGRILAYLKKSGHIREASLEDPWRIRRSYLRP